MRTRRVMADLRARGAACLVAVAVLAAAPARALTWPNAAALADEALGARDAGTRRKAAASLAELPRSAADPLVVRAMGDADLDVRLAAARAGASLQSAAAAEAAIPWMSDPEPRLRVAACEIVRRAPSGKAIVALGRVLADSDANVRRAAARAMGARGATEAVALLAPRLDDPDVLVRSEAAASLARIGSAAAVLPLVGRVGDPAPEVRRAVIRALAELGDRASIPALVLAMRDAVESIRVEALTALGRMRAATATTAMVPLLGDRSSAAVRRAAAAALGRIRTPEAIAALVAALSGEDPDADAAPARDALRDIGADAVPALLAALAAPDGAGGAAGDGAAHPVASLASPSSRATAGAALALGAGGDRRATLPLVRAARAGALDPRVALRALAAGRDPDALAFALESLGDARLDVRRAALAATAALLDARVIDGRAIDPLVAVLADRKLGEDDRVVAIEALGRTLSARAAVPLVALSRAHAGTTRTRLAAIEALGRLGPAAQDEALLAALDDPEPGVRAAAGLSLAGAASEATARALLDRLVRAAESDRAALGVAVAGAFARVRDAGIVARAEALLADASDGAFDAIVEGLGRCTLAASGAALARIARSDRAADRGKAAEALATHPGAFASLRALAHDADAPVRANAAWSLGRTGEAALGDVLPLASDASDEVATNAVAAVARLAIAHAASPLQGAQGALCDALGARSSYARANALVGLAILRARCGDGARERDALAATSHAVRLAAARAVRAAPSSARDADERALATCAIHDPAADVAHACDGDSAPGDALATAPAPAALDVFVVPTDAPAPVASAPYALLRADGFTRAGLADRRGAIFESDAPAGPTRLLVPAALDR